MQLVCSSYCICSSGMFEVTSFYAERKGEREDMQDAHVLIDNFTPNVSNLHEDV